MMKYGRSVCYSGYRDHQSPHTHTYPTDEQALEDLRILEGHFDYIRMYDTSEHAKSVLCVISKNNIKLKAMLGTEPGGEISNPTCPWGGLHSPEEIEYNKVHNFAKMDELILLANTYPDIVFAVSVGNECTSSWHSNLMSPERIAEFVRYVKPKVKCLVTFCEGANYYREHGQAIAKEVDFLSIHSYPVWNKVPFDQAVQATIEDYEETKKMFPDKPIIFTEFGWPTSANDRMRMEETNETNQARYLKEMAKWSEANKILMFIFEAFDEPWKGGNDPVEPEKHWGVYTVERTPKKFLV